MGITNKELDSKLDKIYTKIDQLYRMSNDNKLAISQVDGKVGKFIDRVQMQESRLEKAEGNIEGHDGVINTIEKELDGVCGQVKTHLDTAVTSAITWSNRKWAMVLLAFGSGISLITAIIVEVIKRAFGN
jgi:hypothetical protein